jgi:hypothetical protein
MIYVNGDSWTSGWPDEETYGHREFSWPRLLSLKINDTVINDARASCSNYRIYRRTFDYLLGNSPACAIVCLTSWVRVEYGNSETGKIFQYLPARDPEYYKKDWHPYLAYSSCLRQIISLQLVAKITNTQLFFLDTFKDNLNKTPTLEWFKKLLQQNGVLDKMDDKRITQKFNKIVSLNSHIDYSMFLSEQSYQEIISGCKLEQGHPVKDGHEQIAEFIYQKLNKGNQSWQNHSM